MLNENLNIFTKNEFSQAAMIGGVEIWGIFEDYYDSAFGYSTEAEGRKYCFKVQSSEVVNLSHGDSVQLVDGGRIFKVINVQPCNPDGKLTDLILKEI